GCQKACVLPENPASYRVVRTKSYLFNKAVKKLSIRETAEATGYSTSQVCRVQALFRPEN
ncbi:TPA: hypothetical protein ACQ5T7_005334, partial [Klebsiella pneumoniae]